MRSSLYAEAGGQLGDRGLLSAPAMAWSVLTTFKKSLRKLWIHQGHSVGRRPPGGWPGQVRAEVDPAWRHAARQAHSGTHLIHAALRQVLGPTAVQAGSLNKPGYLRFDFNYAEALTPSQLEEIQSITNQAVDTDYDVNTIETSLEEAKAMGAMALFGENYGDIVRVVEIGGPFSMELCGGTHVAHSSQIGPVAVLGESSVASGVRRIEAYSGLYSFDYLAKERALVSGVAGMLKTPSEELPERIAQLTDKLKAAEKKIAELGRQQLLSQASRYLDDARVVGNVTLVSAIVENAADAGDLRQLATDLKGRLALAAIPRWSCSLPQTAISCPSLWRQLPRLLNAESTLVTWSSRGRYSMVVAAENLTWPKAPVLMQKDSRQHMLQLIL